MTPSSRFNPIQQSRGSTGLSRRAAFVAIEDAENGYLPQYRAALVRDEADSMKRNFALTNPSPALGPVDLDSTRLYTPLRELLTVFR